MEHRIFPGTGRIAAHPRVSCRWNALLPLFSADANAVTCVTGDPGADMLCRLIKG